MSLVRTPAGVELIDLLDRVLDKGIVVDASSRLHLIGSPVVKRKLHVVIAAIETHLHHSEARAVTNALGRRPQRAEEQHLGPELATPPYPRQ
jgi:hypothetical protein